LTAPEPVRGRPRETALSIVVEEAQALVGDFTRRFHPASVAKRIPPHVTLLYPFVDADGVDDDLISSLHELYAPVDPFDFELARVGRFDEVVWLAPEPRGRFVDLIRRTCSQFPEHPPYGGAYQGAEQRPHLTIGTAGGELDIDALASTAEAEMAASLPVRYKAQAVYLLEEQPDGTWAKRTALPLGGR
jgi:2'-5' RNA ligase